MEIVNTLYQSKINQAPLTTQLMIIALSIFDRQEDSTIQKQLDHCLLALFTHQCQDLRPRGGLHSNHMAVGVLRNHTRDVRCEVLLTAH